MSDKRSFEVVKEGTIYKLPVYNVTDKGLNIVPHKNIQLTFVRGSKNPEDNVENVEGTLHENVISAMIHDLNYKNSLVPSRETSLAITNLQQALFWLEERAEIRKQNNTLNTYQK